MAAGVSAVRLDRPPTEFAALVAWFEVISAGLVLLEGYPLDHLRSALRSVSAAVREHCGDALVLPGPAPPPEWTRLKQVVDGDHRRLETSIAQLWWFFGVVEREDHGGNRQALGQYGKALAESLRRHLSDEQRLLGSVADRTPAPRVSVLPGNPN